MSHDDHDGAGLNRSRLLAAVLEVGCWVVLLATAGWFIWRVQQQLPTPEMLLSVAVLFGGFAFALLMWSVAELLRRVDALCDASDSESGGSNWSGGVYEATDGRTDAQAEESLALLHELRDLLLLDDDQRQQKLESIGDDLSVSLENEVPALLREHRWVEARRRVERARERFPGLASWDQLTEQIEQYRAEVESRDVEAARRQIDDLRSLGAWDRVADVVDELLERHPESPEAADLARRVQQDREAVESDQRQRLMEQAQEATNQRNWHAALSAATALVQRFPHSQEAQVLRSQLPILEANAEIQTRKRLEEQYTQLVKAQRYVEALKIARDVLARYPHSPQADVMRAHIDHLEGKAGEVS